MRFNRFIAPLLALMLALLPAAAAEEIVVARFEGGEILYREALSEYQSMLEAYEAIGFGDEANRQDIAGQVLEMMVEDAILRRKAAELGFDAIPEADLSAIEAEAADYYEELVSYYIDFCAPEGASEAEARAATEAFLSESGLSESQLAEDMKLEWYRGALYETLTANAELTEADVQESYTALVTTQQLLFTEDPQEFDYAYANDDLIAWYPAGLRYVKHILIGFDEYEAEAYAELTEDDEISEADAAALDTLYEGLDDRATEVMERLMNGESFEAVMRACGDDEAMLEGPYADNGYIVRDGSALFVPEFTTAVFELMNAGDISDPVRTAGGLHILRYEGNVPSGAVPLADIYDAVVSDAMDQKCADLYDAQMALWLEEAHPEYHPECLLQ